MISRGRKPQLVPYFGSVEMVICLWITCAILTLVASQQKFYIQGRYGKRHEPHAESFFVSGGRYGRSENLGRESKLPKLVEVVPRTDRLFWDSRYGKRSPPDYRPVSSVNRFSAVLNFMDQINLDRENEPSNGNDLDLLS
ncbi:uncharacterized protein LOC108623518 [Ceratina calcarata]|uniref:Uncharacterized protein LOC108623518 n=1 Tax=Ceratina calcarata TaxID=156304 RepID=A0AAJ7IUS0_9HYME|nr:uncharacterized protein LOC108623518 [Ceratina calcarata]XP_017877565.1 uncharacterized protein LOC108623518 [Ceratina calcarata]XP_017877567.1 uncharacterized protein LOC108623518 [Ceratina calcarata]XP_026668167.1 uncharacterized protein LOC108623518 [Ceratina calcarata]XP_026668168.1 uncharacterized protein LOC108623518 [Ceratina calcarata]